MALLKDEFSDNQAYLVPNLSNGKMLTLMTSKGPISGREMMEAQIRENNKRSGENKSGAS